MIGKLRSRRGLTLTEILIVMSLFGVIAMVGQSFLQPSLDHANVTAVTEEIASALRYARDSSVGNKHRYRVSIDADVDTMNVERLEYDSTVFDTSQVTYSDADVAMKVYAAASHPFKRGFPYRFDFLNDPRFGGARIVKMEMGASQQQVIEIKGLAVGGLAVGSAAGNVSFNDLGRPSQSAVIVVGRGGYQMYVVVDTFSGRIKVGEYIDKQGEQ